MEILLVVGLLVVLLLLVVYRLGKKDAKTEELKGEIKASKDRKRISSLTDEQLDDELRKHWK